MTCLHRPHDAPRLYGALPLKLAPMPLADFLNFNFVPVAWLATEWKYLAAVLFVLSCAFLFWRRTGSAHIFIVILWRRFLGQRKNTSVWLTEFLDERDELMRFRALTGVTNAPTLAAAERIAAWSRENDLDMDRVAAARSHLEFNPPGLRGDPPSLLFVGIGAMVSAALFAVATLSALAAPLTPAVIRVIQSDVHYTVEADRAKRVSDFFKKNAGFAQTQCADQSAIISRTAYPAHDIAVLCKLLEHEDGVSYIQEARSTQLWLLFVLAVLALTVGWQIRRTNSGAEAARQLHLQLTKTDRSAKVDKPETAAVEP